MTTSAISSYAVIASRQSSTDRALTAIAKRAAKKGLPCPTWMWGEKTTEIETHHVQHDTYDMVVERKCLVERINLFITAEPIRFAGWTFVATIDHMRAEDGSPVNFVSECPGETYPRHYRDAAPNCDHCRMIRKRNCTYILRHEDGRYVQVGSTCIADFLGGSSALDCADAASIFAALQRAGEAGESGGGSREPMWDLAEFLAVVSVQVRDGGWISRTKARESTDGSVTATVDTVLSYRKETPVYDILLKLVTEEDRTDATAAIDWALSLPAHEVDANEYLYKVQSVARVGATNTKLAGVAASIIPAYQREVGRRRLAAETAARQCDAYLGTVGASKCVFGDASRFGGTTKSGALRKGVTVLTSEPMTLDFVHGYETDYGYTTILKFRTAEGHVVTWFASSTELARKDVGRRFHVAATIKKHAEYQGAKQTTITRANVIAVDSPDAPAVA